MELRVTLDPGEERALQRLAMRLGTDLEGALSHAIRETAGARPLAQRDGNRPQPLEPSRA